ncbi:Putative uncharacterized protein FLJ37770 [Eumeta japonica]|uniref:Histone-lysine N-methyltransferase SETMAR n=1 Tax=Eumeta variegata TaxID=151549 RepID=A0A4C1SCT7_EUMVA|nr:Putative uncharacterized protein FLJ37770 [Eumeta japonica]
MDDLREKRRFKATTVDNISAVRLMIDTDKRVTYQQIRTSLGSVLRKERKNAKEIFEDMVSVLQESAPSYTMVKKWARLFQQGRESCEDDPRPGRPVTVVTEENVRKIEKLVLADRRIKLWQIAEELQISKERVGEIIHEHMNMRKISAHLVPKMLTPFDKQRRLQTSTRGSRTEATWEVIARSAVFTRHASVHTARVSRQALKDTGFSEIDHPPYSPDLAPSDYFLFSNLKKKIRGRRFVDDNQMKMAVESHFDCKEKEYFLGGLKALYTRCRGLISRPSYDPEIKRQSTQWVFHFEELPTEVKVRRCVEKNMVASFFGMIENDSSPIRRTRSSMHVYVARTAPNGIIENGNKFSLFTHGTVARRLIARAARSAPPVVAVTHLRTFHATPTPF